MQERVNLKDFQSQWLEKLESFHNKVSENNAFFDNEMDFVDIRYVELIEIS